MPITAGIMTPLVGRDEELDPLLRRWSQARDGELLGLGGDPCNAPRAAP